MKIQLEIFIHKSKDAETSLPVGRQVQHKLAMKIKLIEIAHGRSGDKGDAANIGIIAIELS